MTSDQPLKPAVSPPKPAGSGGQGQPPSSSDFGSLEDNHLWEIIAGARRARFFARLAGLLAVVAGAFSVGQQWLLGAGLGWLVVEVNLDLLIRTLVRASRWRGRSLWPTVLWFYLVFGVTAGACLVIIRNQWGHPLAFILGLLSFFVGLVLAIFSFIIKKPEPPA